MRGAGHTVVLYGYPKQEEGIGFPLSITSNGSSVLTNMLSIFLVIIF